MNISEKADAKKITWSIIKCQFLVLSVLHSIKAITQRLITNKYYLFTLYVKQQTHTTMTRKRLMAKPAQTFSPISAVGC